MDCSMCGNPIHPARLEAIPIALTCSRPCVKERQLFRARQSATRQRERKKLANARKRARRA